MRRLLPFLLIGILALLVCTSRTRAEGREFSAVAVDPKGDRVYAAFKTAQSRFEFRSSLVEIPSTRGRASRPRALPLPAPLRERELRFLFPLKDGVIVVSQWAIEQGDEPQVHQWFRARRVWKKLGKVACPSPISAQLAPEGLRFECDPNDWKVLKLVPAAGPTSLRIALPQTESHAGPLTATLQGPSWHWDSLKITREGADPLELSVLSLPQ